MWDRASQVGQVYLRLVVLANRTCDGSMGYTSLCLAVLSSANSANLLQLRFLQHSGSSDALCRASWRRSNSWVERYLRYLRLLWLLLVDCDFIVQIWLHILVVAGDHRCHDFLCRSEFWGWATEDTVWHTVGGEFVAGRSDYAISFSLLLWDEHDLWNDNRQPLVVLNKSKDKCKERLLKMTSIFTL